MSLISQIKTKLSNFALKDLSNRNISEVHSSADLTKCEFAARQQLHGVI